MLYQTPSLDASDRRVLTEIDAFRHEFRHQLATPRQWMGQLRRSLTADAIRASTTIEGYSIESDDAAALVAHAPMSTSVNEETKAAVEGYRDALTYVQQAAGFEVFEYDTGLLSALHFMMTRYQLLKWPGRYRSGGVWVAGGPDTPPVYTAPDAEDVPGLMAETLEWLNEGDLDAPLYVRAAIAHLNLVAIHPWRDGNGRMARCLHTLVLARDQVLAPEFSSIEEWLGSSSFNTGLYYQALGSAGDRYRPETNTHEWVRFCLRTHHIQAQLVRRRVDRAARLWTELASAVAARGLNERSVSALYAACTGGARRATYEQDEALTRDQAIRDLRALTNADLIEPVGRGLRQRYLPSPKIRNLFREVQRVDADNPLVEPYPR